jgi:hypothetical protein
VCLLSAQFAFFERFSKRERREREKDAQRVEREIIPCVERRLEERRNQLTLMYATHAIKLVVLFKLLKN